MVVAVVKKQFEKARNLIQENISKLHELAKFLYEKETITGDEFMDILNRKPEELTATRFVTADTEE